MIRALSIAVSSNTKASFNADPDSDPAFYLNADPDPDPGSQTNADPNQGQTLKSQKVFHEKYTLRR
jgi:hypothetical protein